jgi:predicted nucleic acid-binding protein
MPDHEAGIRGTGMRDEHVVVDASALLDLLVTRGVGAGVEYRIRGCSLHAPSHIDAEVFSGLGRLADAGLLTSGDVGRHADTIAAAPIERHAVAELLAGAWGRRGERSDVPLSSALYIELARTLGAPLITTDPRLARTTPVAELVG